MSITATTPISVSEEAKSRIAELGIDHDLERILEHTSKLARGLLRIDVVLTPACDPGDDPRIILEGTKEGAPAVNDPLWRQWRDWMVESFPSDVLRHFNLLTVYGAANGA